ncbi:hypothetical protein K0M31_009261 [Melipona bicolor]|uniref:Ionotropic glutamate receptor C-terminal domain-containing protein n=1 Tax=Melipona bicolor TaxID=60889 RepID=A0AA40FQ15_9HYME|nr:hypothetical protein K0M31_009261 [Melipona bicolor]
MISVLLLLWCVTYGNSHNDFPSLVTKNATMAVIIDKSLFATKDEYRNVTGMMHDLIADIVRKEMQIGGIVVHIFRDTNVNLRQDPDCPRIPDMDGMSVPLIVPGNELSQIFLDLRMMNILTWNMINILHDDTFGNKSDSIVIAIIVTQILLSNSVCISDRDTISRVMKAISNRLPNRLPNKQLNIISRSIFTLKHDTTKGERRNSVKKVLDDFHVEQLGHCFLVIATIDMVADVMSVARSLKMVRPDSQWLYVITDGAMQNRTNMTAYVDLLAEGGNVAFMYNVTNSSDYCKVELMCYVQELIQALAKALEYSLKNEINLFKRFEEENFQMIRLTKHERRTELLKNVRILLSSQNTLASKGICGRRLSWKFSSSITWGNFFSHDKNVAHLLDIGTWTPGFGVNLTDMIFPHIAHGFRGINLPIASYHNPPWQIISVSKTGQKMYGGLVFDAINYLSLKLNFSYAVITPEVTRSLNSWNTSRFAKLGEKINEMTMSATRKVPKEVIDLVRERKVLLAACAVTVNEQEKSTVNFTVPIFVQTYSFLTSRPRQLSRALLFASPFTEETWACLAASIIIMGPFLYLVHKYSPYSIKTSGLNSSWQCVWYVYGALLQQGGMYLPQCDSARLLIGIWWLIVMVLVATYSGSLVAFLTFPRIDTILTVDDLIARKDRITWGFPNGSFFETYLQNAEEPKYHILLSRARRHNDTEDEKLLECIKEGKHALIDWRSSLRFLMRKDLLLTGGCHFSLSTDEFLDEPIAMIIPHDSPYLPVINAE